MDARKELFLSAVLDLAIKYELLSAVYGNKLNDDLLKAESERWSFSYANKKLITTIAVDVTSENRARIGTFLEKLSNAGAEAKVDGGFFVMQARGDIETLAKNFGKALNHNLFVEAEALEQGVVRGYAWGNGN